MAAQRKKKIAEKSADEKTPRKVLIEQKRSAAYADGIPPNLMTAKQLSDYLRVSKSTIVRQRNLGLIPCVRIGKVIRYDVIAVRAALERNS